MFWQFHLRFSNISFRFFTIPLQYLAELTTQSMDWLHYLFIFFLILTILFETVADQQQREFFQAKQKKSKSKYSKDLENGFFSSGLFKYSRHPNYFFELLFWWLIGLFALASTANPQPMIFLGVIFLTALFIGSTIFTESISSSKYPAYRDYQRRTSPIIPFWSKKD